MRLIKVVILCAFSMTGYAQEDEPSYLIRSIYFGGGSYSIDSLQRVELIQFMDSIPDLTLYNISIHSHTDNIGGVAFNKWLSKMRSNTVHVELVEYNINPNSIVIKDFGQMNPVYDNSTQRGRIRNRRVDIVFWPLVF